MLGNLHRYRLTTDAGLSQFVEDLLDLFDTKIGEWRTRPTRDELHSIIRAKSPLAAYLNLYQNETEAYGKSLAFIKDLRVYDWATLLAPILDQTRFIYMVRDPRDMALSWSKAPALRGGVLRAAETWVEDQKAYSRLVTQLEATTGIRVPVINYEALLVEPSKTLKHACSALGLTFEPEMINFHEESRNQYHASMVAEWKNTGRPLISTNAGKFKKELSIEEIRYIETVCAEGMSSLNYEPIHSSLSKSELASTRQVLEPKEPWEKPAYLELPEMERTLRKQQHVVMQRIKNRPWSIDRQQS